MPRSDLDIARHAKMRPITEIGAKLGLSDTTLIPYGHTKAKLDLSALPDLPTRPDGKLILVTAISPTPAGEGKTTTTVGLCDGFNQIGKNAISCLREPSLGPCFGMKGGAAGGGFAQVVPMEDINLHFTGDFHAITAANNLLAAMIDNHMYWGNRLDIDPRRIHWRRVVDMNDRALRSIVNSLGGVANGFPREDGFDISVASEIMAILCLAKDRTDLKQRLGRIVVAQTRARTPVTAHDLKADGAMAALLKDAIYPNLVQTLENNPVLIHGGPFANIAHGCNSAIATKTALKLADYVITEAGFGAELGAEKFFNIKCRSAGLTPDAVVIVATVRALKMHGGVNKKDLGTENCQALGQGFSNLERHITNIKKFGLTPTIAINRFATDTQAELDLIAEFAAKLGTKAFICEHWEHGGKGIAPLATHLVAQLESTSQSPFATLYKTNLPLWDKINVIATELYGAEGVSATDSIRKQLKAFEDAGYGEFPVCMAKTQYSFSADPTAMGAPSGHTLPVREVFLAAGAGFVIVVCGDIMRMPGLPRTPSAEAIDIDAQGEISGLF